MVDPSRPPVEFAGRVFRGGGPVIGCRFVSDHLAECCVVGVCRSGFYAWYIRRSSRWFLVDQEILVEIREFHRESRRAYGSSRVHEQLRDRGRRVGRNRVGCLIRANYLVEACPHHRRRDDRGVETVPADDLLDRDFTAKAPDCKWVVDVSGFGCADTGVHLVGILDLCDRTLVGWFIDEHQTTELVVGALAMAIGRRHVRAGLADQYVGGVHRPFRPRRHRRVLGQRRRLLRQRDHGISLGHSEKRTPPHTQPLGTPRPQITTNRPIRLHRGVIQPPTPLQLTQPPHPRPGLHRPPSRIATTIQQNNLPTKPKKLQGTSRPVSTLHTSCGATPTIQPA